MPGPVLCFIGQCYRYVVNLCQDITVLFLMEDELRCPGTIVTAVEAVPVIHRRTARTRDDLVEVIIRISVVVINSCMIIEMVMAGEVDSTAPVPYALPEQVSLIRVIIKAIRMVYRERRNMSEDKHMGLQVGSKLGIKPRLIDTIQV